MALRIVRPAGQQFSHFRCPDPQPPVVKLCQNILLIMVVCQNVLIPTVWTLPSRDQPHKLHRSSSIISLTYHVSWQIKTSQRQSYLFPLSRFPFFFLPLNTTTWQCPRSREHLKHFFFYSIKLNMMRTSDGAEAVKLMTHCPAWCESGEDGRRR